MWRPFLLVYPFVVVYVAVVIPIFVPITWATGSIRPIYWMARLGCRISLALAGIRVRVLNAERLTEHPCNVFVANHVSNVEAPALFMILPRIAVIIKDSLGRIPLLGFTMKMGGFICVDRQDRNSRRTALERALGTLQSGISMLVFPEGTRSRSGALLPFRAGPFQMAIGAGVPVVPITVHGARRIMLPGETSIRPGVMTLAVHAPVTTDGLEEGDWPTVLDEVRTTMESARGSAAA